MGSIAVDAGTSVVKAVAFDDDGTQLAVARRPVEVSHPAPDRCEQDMDTVWATVVQVVREVAPMSRSVDFLAVTGQGDGAWLVDDDLRPVLPAILWNDARAAGLVRRWRAAGLEDEAFGICGSALAPGLPHAILAWLADRDADAVARARWCLTATGWISLRLTGTVATHVSEASNPYLDLTAGSYSDRLLGLFEMEWAGRLRPPFQDEVAPCNPLSAEAASELGLAPGMPVVLAPYDIVCSAYGTGATTAGDVCTILGTTLCSEALTPVPDLTPSPALQVRTGEDLFVRALATMNGTQVLEWAAALLCIRGVTEVLELAQHGTAFATGLVFQPYLSPAGERAPFHDTSARGSFLGLGDRHGRADLARAVVEGLTASVCECLDQLGDDRRELYVGGGGARSRWWLQLIADVSGRSVVPPRSEELGALGAHLAGLVGTRSAPSVAVASSKLPHPAERFTPDAQAHDRIAGLTGFSTRLRETSSRAWSLIDELGTRRSDHD